MPFFRNFTPSEIVAMNLVRIAVTARLAFAIAVIVAPFVAAQAADSKEAAAPPVGTEPQTTSATYGDWVLRCAKAPDGAPIQKTCEIVQSFQLQGQQGVFAQLAIGRPDPKGALHVIAELPPTITFPSTVKLAVDEKDTQPLELAWKRCLPGPGCYADAELKDDVAKRWKSQTGNGRLSFKDGAGRDAVIPFSFRGLGPALDALAKS